LKSRLDEITLLRNADLAKITSLEHSNHQFSEELDRLREELRVINSSASITPINPIITTPSISTNSQATQTNDLETLASTPQPTSNTNTNTNLNTNTTSNPQSTPNLADKESLIELEQLRKTLKKRDEQIHDLESELIELKNSSKSNSLNAKKSMWVQKQFAAAAASSNAFEEPIPSLVSSNSLTDLTSPKDAKESSRVQQQRAMFEDERDKKKREEDAKRFYRKELLEFKNVLGKNPKVLPTIQLFESPKETAPKMPPSLPPMNSQKMQGLIKRFETKTLRKGST